MKWIWSLLTMSFIFAVLMPWGPAVPGGLVPPKTVPASPRGSSWRSHVRLAEAHHPIQSPHTSCLLYHMLSRSLPTSQPRARCLPTGHQCPRARCNCSPCSLAPFLLHTNCKAGSCHNSPLPTPACSHPAAPGGLGTLSNKLPFQWQ